jgi:hypothetical protein
MTRRIQPMIPAYGEKNNTSDARYPISHKPVPMPAVSFIHSFIEDVLPFPVLVLCAVKRKVTQVP